METCYNKLPCPISTQWVPRSVFSTSHKHGRSYSFPMPIAASFCKKPKTDVEMRHAKCLGKKKKKNRE